MINFGKQEVGLKCPNCGRSLNVKLGQIAIGGTIRCQGCNTGIQLQDRNGSVKKTINDTQAAMSKLEKSLKSFGKR